MRPLFVYGSLRDPDLLAGVIGRAPDRRNVIGAVAPGYAAVFYLDRIYPALVPRPGGRAEGLAILGLSPFELDVLDAFEGAEYRRAIVPVIVEEELHEADVYLPTATIPSGSPPWSLADWQVRHKARVIAEEADAWAEVRARLLAARPN